jgi:hypothetical protein
MLKALSLGEIKTTFTEITALNKKTVKGTKPAKAGF